MNLFLMSIVKKESGMRFLLERSYNFENKQREGKGFVCVRESRRGSYPFLNACIEKFITE